MRDSYSHSLKKTPQWPITRHNLMFSEKEVEEQPLSWSRTPLKRFFLQLDPFIFYCTLFYLTYAWRSLSEKVSPVDWWADGGCYHAFECQTAALHFLTIIWFILTDNHINKTALKDLSVMTETLCDSRYSLIICCGFLLRLRKGKSFCFLWVAISAVIKGSNRIG